MEQFEEQLHQDLHQFLQSMKEVDERLPECPDVEEKWEQIAKAYIPDGIREFNDFPSASLGWMMYIGYNGIDHILHSNENIKILVLDTEVYSNTGGQASKSTNKGAVAEFADFGKKTNKKDLFKIASGIENVYVASVCLGANIVQTINAFKEAEEHNGPAIIIAYCPCIEHGISKGLGNSLNEAKLAVECGYTILMRLCNNNLIIDSKEPNFDRYNELLDNEVRFKALKLKDEAYANEMLQKQKGYAIKRYEYYKSMQNKNSQ